MIVKAPFNDEQIRSMNLFQKQSSFTRQDCRCGFEMFATEKGWTCPQCHEVIGECELFITNHKWEMFKEKEIE